ncbi:DegT/DnrJ/EryC1/StrS family aminotransferase, partial [Francisella tularensis subsp. holarctica]|uniref:DegT/DnrJ/EryC1/StrS family aminotransferase n=1 Tax=Francisella tularensis TaxID=263 RepID=UPI002381AB17
TIALEIAYRALGVKGSAITTQFSFVATTSSLVSNNVNPVFVDIDENTLSIDVSKIKYAIEEDTSAIVPVHVFGNGC